MAKLAEVLRTFGQGYLDTHALGASQARAWRAILSCRTEALGGTSATLRALRLHPQRVPFLPEPALPAMPVPRQRGVGERAIAGGIAGTVRS